MQISYFLYSLLVSAWIFTDAPLHNHSRWWALGVFIIPIIIVYYFVKTRPAAEYWKCIGLWIIGFVVLFIAESVFLQREQVKPASVIPSVSSSLKEQVQNLSKKTGLSATNFQKATISIDELRDINTIPKINESIGVVERVQLLFYQANEDSDNLYDFISRNKTQLRREGLDVFLDMEGLRSETYTIYRKALREYLNTYKTMLEYSRDNFEAAINSKEPQSGTYNRLYLKYRNALDVHNEAYLQHMKYVDQYSLAHPALAELITNARQDLRKK